MSVGLTIRQSELLRFIAAYVREKGVSPTYDEMCEAMGWASKGMAHRTVNCLIERGRLCRWRHQERGLTLVKGRVMPRPTTVDALIMLGSITRSQEARA